MAGGNTKNRILLKKVLFRIDFQWISESVQERLFDFVGKNYSDYFMQQDVESVNSVDVFIDNAIQTINKPQSIYVFSAPLSEDSDGRVLKIGRTFIFLELTLSIKNNKIPYYELFASIINELNHEPLFKPTRIGLRKFNSFYILEDHIESFNEIFKIDFKSDFRNQAYKLFGGDIHQTYFTNKDGHILNFTRGYGTGRLSNAKLGIENKEAHLVSFDFDLYSTNLEALSRFRADAINELDSMSNEILCFFKETVSNDFFDALQSGILDIYKKYNVIPLQY